MTQPRGPSTGMPPTDLEQRRNALRAMLVISPLGGLVFLALNLRLEAALLSGLSIALILGSLVLLLALRRGVLVQRLALIYLPLVYAPILVALARPDVHPGAANSMAMLPVLAYLLLEIRAALPVAGLALAAAATAYFAGTGLAPYRLEPLVIAHIAMPAIALLVGCHFYCRNRARSSRQMLERMFRDPLTRLWNRDKLDIEFEREANRSRRTGAPLTLLLVDLDRFKELNDRYGHAAGDAVLVGFAERTGNRLREIDIACRIGGEEFALLLPDTDRTGGTALAHDLRSTIGASPVRYGEQWIAVTVSVGVAQLGRDGTDWSSLYQAADERLYEAKAAGRDMVVGDSQGSPPEVDARLQGSG